MTKLFSEACERNKLPIFEIIKETYKDTKNVLEIGSGTGQHSIFFAEKLPNLVWQTSDLIDSHESIKAYINDSNLNNIKFPLLIDVSTSNWHDLIFESAFTANTFHIISSENVEKTFIGLSNVISKKFCVYGPFNYDGKYTSQSNYNFDLFLKKKYPNQAFIKDIEFITSLAKKYNFELINDFEMPSNNRLLVFNRF
jgi:cyclopropane fatty-acyl-phospholipid synthase-like methyltransferase